MSMERMGPTATQIHRRASEGVPTQELTGEPQLVQLQYRNGSDDAWRMMVCCILLNQTTRRQLDTIRHELFRTYANSHAMAEAGIELEALIRPLGLQNVRAKRLRKFSEAWTTWEVVERSQHETSPIAERVLAMPGIGKYALDSYRMIFLDEWEDCVPDDKELVRWKAWRAKQA